MSGISNAFFSPSQADVFICFSPEDEKYMQELRKHVDRSKLHIWDETMVSPGSNLSAERAQALQSAKVVILLSSTNLFANENFIKYIREQVINAASQERITLINVILRSYDLKAENLAQFQPVNPPPSPPLVGMSPTKREKIWVKVVKQINNITEQSDFTLESLFDQSKNLQIVTRYFFRCQYMKSKKLRGQLLRRLPEEWRQEMDAFPIKSQANGNSDFEEVFNLVSVCSFDPNGLEKLAYEIYQLEHASTPWLELDKYLRSNGQKLVTYTRLQELYSILKPEQWLDHLLSRAYRDSIPESWGTLCDYNVLNKLHSIVDDLIKIPIQNDNIFPLLEFVQRLAYFALDRSDKTLHDALSKWVKERSSDLGLTEDQRLAMNKKSKKRRSNTAVYLLMALDTFGEGVLYVQSWLLDEENCIIQNVNMDMPDELCSLEDVPKLLDDLLERCEAYLQDEMKNLIVEFFLPLELLSYPVDQYTISDLKKTHSISLDYPIVVRSLDRMRNQKKIYRWKDKWNLLRNYVQEAPIQIDNKNSIFIYNEECYKGPEEFLATLRGSAIACLALNFVPSHPPFQKDEVLLAVLEAGVPVALWPREQTDYPKSFHDLLTELVLPHSLSQLPAFVKQQRCEALASGKKQQHQGHHLTLLWDDPNRLPPSMMATRQLMMPPTRKKV